MSLIAEAFKAVMAALEPLKAEEQIRVLESVSTLLDIKRPKAARAGGHGGARASAQSIRARATALLADGNTRTAEEVGTALGASVPSVASALHRLFRSGLAERVGPGLYRSATRETHK